MKHVFIWLSLLAGTHQAAGQTFIGMEEIPAKDIKPWTAASPKDFQGVYHFGESEGESQLVLVVAEGIITAQIKSGNWVRVKGKDNWKSDYETLSNVRIVGNKFSSAKISGEFVSAIEEGQKKYGLKVRNSGSGSVDKGGTEIGVKTGSVKEYYSGIYPQASYQLLQANKLAAYSKAQLAIMRNEIFARYGYIFSASSGMLPYFKKQEWYQPAAADVSRSLTEIEKKNIALLKELEAKM
jgi:hypothetical protein